MKASVICVLDAELAISSALVSAATGAELVWCFDRAKSNHVERLFFSKLFLNHKMNPEKIRQALQEKLTEVDGKVPSIRKFKKSVARNWLNKIPLFPQRSFPQASRIEEIESIRSILICPLCKKAELKLKDPPMLSCANCSRVFPFDEFDIDLMPHELALGSKRKIWAAWFETQVQALAQYKAFPTWNVSNSNREDVKAFRKFMNLSGEEKILDIGCGILSDDAYVSGPKELVFGIDPYLSSRKSHSFTKIRGIAEALPFTDAYFDVVVFATSLDHVVDPLQTLKEARRVTKDNGQIYIWDTLVEHETYFTDPEYLAQFDLPDSSVLLIQRFNWLSRVAPRLWYIVVGSTCWLKRKYDMGPTRVDGSHLYRISMQGLERLAKQAALAKTAEQNSPQVLQHPFRAMFCRFAKVPN